MPKRAVIIFLAMLVLASGVNATANSTGNLNITSFTSVLSPSNVNASGVAAGNFTIDNTALDTNLSSISFITEQIKGSKFNISPSQITFSPSFVSLLNTTETKLINFTLTVPDNTFADSYTALINTTNNSGSNDFFETSFTVNPSPLLALSNVAASWVRTITTSAASALTITNQGNTDLKAINFTISDLVGANANISNSKINISGNATDLNFTRSKNLNILFTPPSGIASGTYRGNITAIYDGKSAMSNITFTVTDPVFSLGVPSSLSFGDVERDSVVSSTFTATNNGNATLNNVIVNWTSPSKYNLSFNQTNIGTLLPNEARIIFVNATIPLNEPTGSHSIGTINLRSNEINASSFDLNVNVLGKLIIDDLNVDIDGDTDSNIKNGDKIGVDAKPLSNIKFQVRVKNRYPSASRIEIRDISVRVVIEDIDDGDNLEEESDEFDLDAGDNKKVSLNFDVPLKVDEGTFTVRVELDGKDENNIEHSVEWKLDLEVNKESHKISIRKAQLTPIEVICKEASTLDVSLTNLGADDEDEVFLVITSPELGININEGPIEMESDPDSSTNTYDKEVSINLKKDIKPGNYKIEVRAYREGDQLEDIFRPQLTVNECKKEEAKTIINESVIVKTLKNETIQPGVIVGKPITETGVTEISFKESSAYVALLVLANIVVIGTLIAIIVRVFFIKR